MKKQELETMSLGETAAAIEQWDSQNNDFTVHTKDISFSANGDINALSIPYADSPLPMTTAAFKQFSNALSVPGHWSEDNDKCPSDLRELIINHRLQAKDTKWSGRTWLVRTQNEFVRAMLSSYYQPYDHLEFFRTVDAILANLDLSQYARVVRLQLDQRMRMWVVFPGRLPEYHGNGTETYDGLGIGKIYSGIYLGNDETGKGSITIAPGLIRALCSNGAVAWQEDIRFTRVHVSLGTALHDRVAYNITKAIENSEGLLNDFMSLLNVPVKRPKMTIDLYSRNYRLPIDVTKEWLEWSNKVGDNLNMWDMVNIVTELSQKQPLALAETMDRMSGDMIAAYALKGK